MAAKLEGEAQACDQIDDKYGIHFHRVVTHDDIKHPHDADDFDAG